MIPTRFISSPANMKKGMASKGKESVPLTMRCTNISIFIPPLKTMKTSELRTMAKATGILIAKKTPSAISIRVKCISIDLALLLRMRHFCEKAAQVSFVHMFQMVVKHEQGGDRGSPVYENKGDLPNRSLNPRSHRGKANSIIDDYDQQETDGEVADDV